VFHRRIKSSGYGKGPIPLKLGQQPKELGKTKNGGFLQEGIGNGGGTAWATADQYPCDCGVLDIPQPQCDKLLQPQNIPLPPILSMGFAQDASSLSVGCIDGSVHMYKLPLRKYKVRATPRFSSLPFFSVEPVA